MSDGCGARCRGADRVVKEPRRDPRPVKIHRLGPRYTRAPDSAQRVPLSTHALQTWSKALGAPVVGAQARRLLRDFLRGPLPSGASAQRQVQIIQLITFAPCALGSDL